MAAAFEDAVREALGYKGIYPAMDRDAYQSRTARVYRPKADWAFEALEALGRKPQDLRWADIGCGPGTT